MSGKNLFDVYIALQALTPLKSRPLSHCLHRLRREHIAVLSHHTEATSQPGLSSEHDGALHR